MPIPSSLMRGLKSRAQLLQPILKLGHAGVTDAFLSALGKALDDHSLVKIRFTDFKDEKKTLARQIAERTNSDLVMRVGNVAVYYRQPAAPLADS